jgi:crotonobetainyl-CoA:carnitine CoA-transferase CaiB-like acyl-CoA transferase
MMESMIAQSLKGLKVIELGNFVAAPYCGKLFADFDAEVIKIEQPGTGDEARRRGPFPGDVPHLEKSGTFLYLNSNKLSITLNLETSDGRDIFRELIADADILIEDRPPGEMKRLGLDYESLRKLNPGLIMTSITPFGQDGPYRDYKAYHLNLYHASGQSYLLPMFAINLDVPPVQGPGFLGEYDGGMAGAIATLAALIWRGSGGTGQHIDISKQHAMFQLERSQLRRFIDDGTNPNRTGKGRLLESLVECRDGYCVVILSSQSQWEGLFEAMGRPEWGAKEPFNTQAGRSAHYPELRERLNAWSKTLTTDELFHRVQKNGSACAPIQTVEQIFNSDQYRSRDYFEEIEHPLAGRYEYPGNPFRLSNVTRRDKRPAPLLGQHNQDIYCGRVGHSQADLVKLAQAGVI